jgi:gluconokinase
MSSTTLATPLILTLDIGTSSTRVMLFDAKARPVTGVVAQQPYRVQTTPDGGAEFDVEALLNAVIQTIDQVLEQAGSLADQIGGVAVDTMVTNILGLNAAGEAITPVLTYADTRSAAIAGRLKQSFGLAEIARIHNRTGALVHASYLPPRFIWMAEKRPEWIAGAGRWASVGEYLFWRLFGRWQISYSVASWSGLLNRHTLSWDEEWLSHLPVTVDQLSPLGDVNEPFTGLLAPWATRWPSLMHVPWFPAIGDGAAANIGSGCTGPTRLALTIGTSGAMRVVLPSTEIVTVPDGLWLYRVDARRAVLGGATTEGGNLFAWFKNTLQLPPGDELEQALAALPPAGHTLTVLPFVAGERAPGWHDHALASLLNLSLNTQPVEIVRAGLEAVAIRFSYIYRRVAAYLPDDPQIVASGGILHSPVWLQIFADVLDRPVITLAEKEATSRGVALLALEALGVIEAAGQLAPATGPVYSPNPEAVKQYLPALEQHEHYYNLLIAGED